MKIAIYSPYLDTAGGGEKYILTIAEAFSQTDEVSVLLDDHLFELGIENIKSKIQKLHGLDLSKVNFIEAPIGKGSSFLSRIIFLKKYDWLIYLTDGSVFYSTAKNNVIHFQVPFENAPKGVWGNLKLKSWNVAIYNSDFTKESVEKNWKIRGEVIYPPVSVDKFKILHKKKQILSVGRFFGYLQDKKHRFLIESFKELVDKFNLDDWSLILVGGAGEGDKEYLNDLRKTAENYRIEFYTNAPFDDIVKIYGESQIYWHASGFEETDPKKFEHFGITTVEAMSAGCVPVVINKGGLKEIVENKVSGYLWDNKEELLSLTHQLVCDRRMFSEVQKNAILKSKQFSKQLFVEKIRRLVYG